MSGEVVLVILAAGSGSRLGGAAKALLPLGGSETFLARLSRIAGEGGAGRGVVVVGPPHGEPVAAEAVRLGREVAHNPDPSRGMSSSVAVGFEHAARRFGDAAAALLWPVDHAQVAPATVARLVDRAEPGTVLVPTWSGRGGHPTGFGRALWAELAGCGALPRGARSVRDRLADRVRRIEVDDPGVVADVDRADDLP